MASNGLTESDKTSDKSNSTADAVQVEANLQDQLSNNLHFRQEWAFTTLGRSRFESLLVHVSPELLLATVGRSQFKSLTFKGGKVMENNLRNNAIRWQMSKSTNVIFRFVIFAKRL